MCSGTNVAVQIRNQLLQALKRQKSKKNKKNKKNKKRRRKKSGEATRMERSCERAANPYALQSASLSAGAHGMACRLAALATGNPFEPLRLMDTHDAVATVSAGCSAAAQCASTHTPPLVALTRARKRTAAAPTPVEVSSAELLPLTCRHSYVFSSGLLH